MSIIAETVSRVEKHTSPRIQQRIAATTQARLDAIGSNREAIRKRLRELDLEWDIERAIEANASTLILSGGILALTVDRRFAWLSGIVAGFLLQHAIQGWCPPVPILRRMGFRTVREIDGERQELLRRL